MRVFVLAMASALALSWAVAGGTGRPAMKSVTYFPADRVAAAFSKGDVLVGEGDQNYMVHASRRVMPGQAEIHEKDTDIIYVLEGRATFVTGGAVVDGRTTAPGEIRGPSIQDGETRQLMKGDVMIVPGGVPHWFKEVDAPFLYYVVKVR